MNELIGWELNIENSVLTEEQIDIISVFTFYPASQIHSAIT